jgi:hypothetical protein
MEKKVKVKVPPDRLLRSIALNKLVSAPLLVGY